MSIWVDAGPEQPDPKEEVRSIRRADLYLAAAFVGGEWFAFADSCTHDGCPLSDGILDAGTIECSCHGSIFDIRDGSVVRGPARAPIATYPTTIRDRAVWIRVEGDPP